MADQQRPGEASADRRLEGDDLALEAPDRGSAEELLDAGAHAPLDLMRHSAAHVMAEAVLAPLPGRTAGNRAGDRGRVLLRLRAAATAHPGRPRGRRGADADEHRRRPPVRPPRAAVRRGARAGRRRGPGLQGGDPRRPGREGRGGGRAAAGHDVLRARRVPRPLPRAARRVDRADRPVPAPRGGRRLLARPGVPADAPARLRHGLGDPGGAGPVPVAPRGGARSATTAGSASSSTCSASTTSARDPPSGTRRASACGGRSRPRCASSRSATATRRSRRRSW